VGRLYSIDDATGTLGFAKPIGPILTVLGITIIPTDETEEYDVSDWDEERIGVTVPPRPEDVFAAVPDRLQMTEAGQELLTLFRRHRREIAELVNHLRPVTLAWHRSQGPSYLAVLMRRVREPAYRIPDSLNEVTREEIVQQMREVFTRQANAEALIRLWLECSTIDEPIQAWEREHATVTLLG
jgi:hypothetical protein